MHAYALLYQDEGIFTKDARYFLKKFQKYLLMSSFESKGLHP